MVRTLAGEDPDNGRAAKGGRTRAAHGLVQALAAPEEDSELDALELRGASGSDHGVIPLLGKPPPCVPTRDLHTWRIDPLRRVFEPLKRSTCGVAGECQILNRRSLPGNQIFDEGSAQTDKTI